jgi:hypothetical protein
MARDGVPLLEREGELSAIAQRLAVACEGAGGLLMIVNGNRKLTSWRQVKVDHLPGFRVRRSRRWGRGRGLGF